jgi:hypothetical protein
MLQQAAENDKRSFATIEQMQIAGAGIRCCMHAALPCHP